MTPRTVLVVLGLMCIASFTTPALAQDTLSAGELLRTRYVRIAAPAVAPEWLTGHLVALDSTQFVLQTVRAKPWRIPRDRVTAIQIGVGRGRTESILRGMGIGALAGFGSLLAYEYLLYGTGEWFGLFAFIFGVPVGALSGGVVGASQSDLRWVDVVVAPAP